MVVVVGEELEVVGKADEEEEVVMSGDHEVFEVRR